MERAMQDKLDSIRGNNAPSCMPMVTVKATATGGVCEAEFWMVFSS